MKTKNLQLLYPENLLFRIKGQIKSFPDKKKLKDIITTKPVLHNVLRVFLKKKEEEEGEEGKKRHLKNDSQQSKMVVEYMENILISSQDQSEITTKI